MGTDLMYKRQPTLLNSAESGPIGLANVGKSTRNHVLSKANDLSGDIASLNDPNISELYKLLKTELEQPSRSSFQTRTERSTEPIDKSDCTESDRQQNIQELLGKDPNKAEVAYYVHSITRELKTMCVNADLKFLAYLVDMACVEANNISAQQP